MFFAKRRRRKQAEAEFNAAVDAIYETLIAHVENGGEVSDLIVVVLWESVEWDMERQSWAVDVVEGGVSWQNGSVDAGKLKKGQRVSMMSGRGGRMEDAVVVSGRKVTVDGSAGYRYLLDFDATGGAEPWFKALMVE